MKKTFITLLALTGVAMGENYTLTTGYLYTAADGTETFYDGTTATTNSNLGFKAGDWSGSRNLSQLEFDVYIADMYGAQDIAAGTAITLNSIGLRCHQDGWCMDEGRTITVTAGENTWTGTITKYKNGNDITIDTSSFTDLTIDSVITITLKPAEGTASANMSIGVNDMWVKDETQGKGQWMGVEAIDVCTAWGTECPNVKLNITTLAAPDSNIPEPTTATLSLLALAGLCARRRRA